MKVNLALISPNHNVYSETFIQEHKNLGHNIFYYYGAYFPVYLEKQGKILVEGRFKIIYYIKKLIGLGSNLDFFEISLIRSFKKNKITVVLAEYGPTGVSVLNVCKHLNIPLLVHFHGFDASHFPTLKNYKDGYINLFAYAKYIIVVSTVMKGMLIELGCPEDKLILNTYGPSPEFAELKCKFSKQQFIAIGRFVEKKAPYLSIFAFHLVCQKFNDVKLILGGEGELLGVCKNIVKVLGLEDKIIFKGILSINDVKELFVDSLALIQHSVTAVDGDMEGTPVIILEAAGAGLPIISTKHAGIQDVVIHGSTGFLVDEVAVKEMADFMIKILQEPDLARKMGDAGKQFIANNFTLKKHLDVLDALISKAINE